MVHFCLPSFPSSSVARAWVWRGIRSGETQGRDFLRPALGVAGCVRTQPRPHGPSAAIHSLGRPLTLLLLLYLSAAGMDASWRQVAAGRGRARGRATAVPLSGNGVPLGGAGGGRAKGSGGAVPPGPGPGGAATLVPGVRRQRSSGGEAPQPPGARGEDGSGEDGSGLPPHQTPLVTSLRRWLLPGEAGRLEVIHFLTAQGV